MIIVRGYLEELLEMLRSNTWVERSRILQLKGGRAQRFGSGERTT